jgi:hypothetical protein
LWAGTAFHRPEDGQKEDGYQAIIPMRAYLATRSWLLQEKSVKRGEEFVVLIEHRLMLGRRDDLSQKVVWVGRGIIDRDFCCVEKSSRFVFCNFSALVAHASTL